MFTKSVVLNRPLKVLAHNVLSSPLTKFSLYQYAYKKRMNKVMSECEVKPHRVRLENTNDCKYNCKFCPHSKMKRPVGYMKMSLFKDLAKQVKEWGVEEIVIQGFGEPLKDPYFFERIRYASKLRIPKIQTNINSRSLTKHNANYLLNSGLTELYISCNDKGEDKVKYLLRQKRKELPEIYLSFIEGETKPYEYTEGADGVSVSYPHNWAGFSNSNFSCAKDPCRLLWVTMYITWDGFAHLCCMDYESTYKYGDAKKTPLRELWNWNPYRVIHKQKKWEQIPVCKGCSYNCHNKSPWWV